jgi:hypothetical protein
LSDRTIAEPMGFRISLGFLMHILASTVVAAGLYFAMRYELEENHDASVRIEERQKVEEAEQRSLSLKMVELETQLKDWRATYERDQERPAEYYRRRPPQ